MGVYTPPSIRTVREDIQGSVVINNGQVIPALIGKGNGKTTTVPAYQAAMAAGNVYTFPALGVAGPVLAITGLRSQPSGGINYVAGTDYVFTAGPQTVDWTALTPLTQPYNLTPVDQVGTSALVAGTTVYYVITALKLLDAVALTVGETIASNQQAYTPPASNHQAVLSWVPVVGADKGYKIYRSTVSGNFTGNCLLATINNPFTTTYTDVGNATSAGSPPGLSTYGAVTSGNAAPFVLSPAQTLTGKIDGGAVQTATFNATRASKSGTAITYPVTITAGVNDTLKVSFDGGALQTVTLPAGSKSLNDIIAAISGTPILGGYADANAGQLRLNSNTQGTSSSVNIDATSTSLTTLGLTSGSASGTGNVANIAAVTAAEVASVVQAAFAGSTTSVAANKITITTNTAGSGGSVQVTGGTANTAINYDTAVHSGATATAGTALRRPALNGGLFYVDYTYLSHSYFQVGKYTSLNKLLADYGVGSNLAIAATLAMASSGRGNAASIVLAMEVPDDTLFTYQTALTFLEKRKDVDLVVPLTVVSGINNAVKQHCDLMSDVNHMRERIGVVGVPIGTQVGDDITAGTAIYLANQADDRRMILTYPWPFIDVQQSNGSIVTTELDGWATAAALAGMIAALPDRATSPTSQAIQGINKLGLELDETEMNLLGAAGVCVVTEEDGNFIIRDGITTVTGTNAADQEISINLTDDFLRKTLRAQFKAFRGRKLLPGLLDQIQKRTAKILQQFVKFQLIVGFDAASISAQQDPDVLTKITVRFTYQPVFPARIIEFRYAFDLKPVQLAA